MQKEVLLVDLINDFAELVKNHATHLEISRKFNCLSKYLGPMEMKGLREAWAYHDSPIYDKHPWAVDSTFEDTIDFLRYRCKGIKVYTDC